MMSFTVLFVIPLGDLTLQIATKRKRNFASASSICNALKFLALLFARTKFVDDDLQRWRASLKCVNTSLSVKRSTFVHNHSFECLSSPLFVNHAKKLLFAMFVERIECNTTNFDRNKAEIDRDCGRSTKSSRGNLSSRKFAELKPFPHCLFKI